MSTERTMKEKYYRVIKRLRCLGNPIRFQICRHLIENEELSVKELSEKIGAPANNISQHLGNCRDLDLVRYRHQGKFVFYRLKQPDVVKQILDLAEQLSRADEK